MTAQVASPGDVTLTIDGGIATVTLARGPVNAFDRTLREELIHLFDVLSTRSDVGAIILRSGLKVFSAGADLRERPEPEGTGSRRHTQRLTREMFAALREASIPVIAVLDGPVIGAGVALAMSCDLVLCSPKTELRLTELEYGRIADVALLRRILPRAVAARVALLGQPLTADDMLRFGLCSQVCESHQLEARARDWAQVIASRERQAVCATKLALNTVEALPAREGSRFVQHLSDGLV